MSATIVGGKFRQFLVCCRKLPIYHFRREEHGHGRSRVFQGMTAEQCAEAERLFEVVQQATANEQWRICCLMASKQEPQLLGQTEFELRERVLRIGAIALEAAVNQRRMRRPVAY